MEGNIFDWSIKMFKDFCKGKNIDVTISDETIAEIVKEYLDCDKLTTAGEQLHSRLKEYVGADSKNINWSLDRDELEKTPEYIKWHNHLEIDSFWYQYERDCLVEEWVKIHGKAHTDEESAKIAADKWCELIFGKHIQDNGALNENHSFLACALGTIVADKCKESITNDVVENTHKLFYEYYLHKLHFDKTYSKNDLEWLLENLPDNSKEDPYDWKFGFEVNLYCDYGPTTPLHLILVNGGVPENDTHSICPWKTGISIRPEDNMVMYRTYGRCDEL